MHLLKIPGTIDQKINKHGLVVQWVNLIDFQGQGLEGHTTFQHQSSTANSNERLMESGRKTPDFEYYSQVFPPEIARQLMIGELRNS